MKDPLYEGLWTLLTGDLIFSVNVPWPG